MNTHKHVYNSVFQLLMYTKHFTTLYKQNSTPLRFRWLGTQTLLFAGQNRIGLKKTVQSFMAVCFIFLLQASCAQTERGLPALDNKCSSAVAIPSEDGIRRLAMIIGVGEYISPGIPDLPGPPEDAKRFYDLLTGPQGYGFPKQNVCVLLDEAATTENFKEKFTQLLTDRAKENDEVVFYFAGHGSQTKDLNYDEPDGMDETFVFHDARSKGVKDFVDDEFDILLTKLYKKTKNITVFLDSCNSGTAMRGDVALLSRYVPPELERLTDSTSNARQTKENITGWVSQSLPGVVYFTAAGDGTSAMEKNARGIFTDAVLSAFGNISHTQPTYAQLARQIRPLVKAESYQIPYFQGNLSRTVFSDSNRMQPLSWDIITVKPQITLGGFPLPGISKGAEFRVYDGSVKGADTQDPEKAKGLIILEQATSLNARARITSKVTQSTSLQVGDLAILARPGDSQRLLKLTLRPQHKGGGISSEQSEKIAKAIEKHSDAKTMISLVKEKGDFELSYEKNVYVIRGPENTVRNHFANEKQVIKNLRLHAIQKALVSLRGEGADMFVDHDTLQVQIVPAKSQNPCAQWETWHQTSSNSTSSQEIPLCYKWNIKVKMSQKSSHRLLIGGYILSTDGSIFGFPQDGAAAPLGPGEEVVFAGEKETFVGAYPLNIEDQVIVFGTQENNPVPWAQLTQAAEPGTKSRGTTSRLFSLLDGYLSGTRGVALDSPVITKNKDTAWTLSSISMHVVEHR